MPGLFSWQSRLRKVGQHLRGATIITGLLLAVLILIQLPVAAQNATGLLTGTAVDATGAVVPKAKVVLKNEASNTTRDTLTNGSGMFSFAGVYPASYTLTVSAAGFNSWQENGIAFTQGASVNIPNIVLQVSGTRSEVQVVATSEAVVPVDTGQSSQTLNQHMVEDLSIVGRDAAELMKIMPGMAMTGGLSQNMWSSYTTATNTGPIGAFSANGTQPNGSMTMTSDGANLLDPGNQGTQTANVNQNQVAEVSVLTSAYGAEFAKGPVTFQAIGKSGGAQFHGSGYLYTRNSVFNAEDSFAKSQGAKKPIDSFYYPGGDFGGPLIIPGLKFNKHRDKLFFYTAYEYMKQQPAGSLQSRFLETQDMMNGNFSPSYIASLGPNFKNSYGNETAIPCSGANSCTSTSNGTKNMSLPGGIVPATMLDPNSLAYWKTFPAANVDPTANSSGANYQFFLGPPQNRWEYRLRGDYNISEKTKLFFSWNTQREHDISPIGIWWNLPGAIPFPTAQQAVQKSNVYSANLTHVFSPTMTNEFIYAQANFINPILMADPSKVNPDKLGFSMTGLFTNQYTPQIPNVFSWSGQVPGYGTYQYGSGWTAGGKGSFGKLSQTPNLSDNFTWMAGKSVLKAGFYWDYARNNQTTGGEQFATMGAGEFENYGSNSSGNPYADFAMARETGFYQAQGAPTADMRYYQYSWYISDQYKASRRLTITAGVRLEHMGNWFPASNTSPGLAVWDPYAYVNSASAGAWTGLQWNAINKGIPVSGFPSKALFVEPRIGAAYDLFGNGKTVLRGGFGVYRYQLAYNPLSGGALADPLNIENLGTTWNCCIGWGSFNQFSPGSGTPGYGTGLSTIPQMGDARTPYTETYNFTISQRAPWNSVVELQYSGNVSHDMELNSGLSSQDLIPLGSFFNPDPRNGSAGISGPGGTTPSGFNGNDYYQHVFYNGVSLLSHGSYSNYNAFILSWQKQTGRATFTTNYTFSKALGIRDNETDNGAGQGSTVFPYNLRSNYGVLQFDRTHIFNAAYVFNLPKPIHNNKLLEGVVNGWMLSGITQFQSGGPIQPSTGGSLNAQWPGSYSVQNYLGSNAPNLILEPQLTCDPRHGAPSGGFFNPACFAPPTGGANGNLIWPYIKGPAFFNSDLAVYKNFTWKEHQKVQFRMSAFNFLNHPLPEFNAAGNNTDIQLNFNNNNALSQTNINTNTSGKPLNTVGRRVIEFSVKYNF
jgi:hypothetical protein